MMELFQNFTFCLSSGIFCYALQTIYVVKIENEYRAEFKVPPFEIRKNLLSLLLPLGLYVWFAFKSQQFFAEELLIPLGLATSVLGGVQRVDSFSLLIPDRYQLLGWLSGSIYVALLIASGESWQTAIKDAVFGLAIVGFLWILSIAYQKLRGRIGIGLGDIKLLSWLALFTGSAAVDVITISVFVGIIYVVGKAALNSFDQKKLSLPNSQEAFAFGPFIVISFGVTMFLRFTS